MHDIHAPIGKIPFQEGAELHLLGQYKYVPIMFGWALNYDWLIIILINFHETKFRDWIQQARVPFI